MSVKSDNIVTNDMTVLSDMTGQVCSTAQKVTYVHAHVHAGLTDRDAWFTNALSSHVMSTVGSPVVRATWHW